MEGGDDTSTTTGTKRRYMSAESSSDDDNDDRHSRSKTWSSSVSSNSEAAARSSLPSSSSKVTNLDSLPDNLLVEVLCRLPSSNFASQCKCVSNRWCTLISDPYFISRFVSVQIDRHKQTQAHSTLITSKGEELLNRIPSSAKLLAPLFNKLGLEQKPIVLATYNDLVLCCATEYDQRDYYICNPYTSQWESLPPPPQVHKFVAAGFLCDHPYYSCKTDNGEGHTIKLNDAYRCRVVRIIIPDVDERFFTKFKVEIFSFETGAWTESIVSTPSVDHRCYYGFMDLECFAYNGMLYLGSSSLLGTILIGLDPFMINTSTTTSTTSDLYKCHYIQLERGQSVFEPSCLGVYAGCLRMREGLEYIDDKSRNLYVWDLNEGNDGVGRLAIPGGSRAVNVRLEDTTRLHQLRNLTFLSNDEDLQFADLKGYDPCNEDIVYLEHGGGGDNEIVEYNIRTSEWSKIHGKQTSSSSYFPITIPWWPTPVPRVPKQAARIATNMNKQRTQCCTN